LNAAAGSALPAITLNCHVHGNQSAWTGLWDRHGKLAFLLPGLRKDKRATKETKQAELNA
jgi:hypothetical protein